MILMMIFLFNECWLLNNKKAGNAGFFIDLNFLTLTPLLIYMLLMFVGGILNKLFNLFCFLDSICFFLEDVIFSLLVGTATDKQE